MAETEEAAAGEVADEQAVAEQAVNEKEKARITELQGWHREKEAASRHNRNLLQYAGALALVLGIGGGSGGFLAVGLALWKARATTEPAIPAIKATTDAAIKAANGAAKEAATGAFGALASLPWWAWTLVGVAAVGVVVVVLLAALLIRTLWYRQEAELQADEHRHNLIAIDPTLFPLEKE